MSNTNTMPNLPTQPFFIVGSGRSGTTMLRLMLNRHPELRIPPESWWLIDLLEVLPVATPLSKEDISRAGAIITGHVRWKDWNFPEAHLKAALGDLREADLAVLVDTVFRTAASMGGKQRWGDKTPK
jgi:hypothetical protein